MKLPFLPPFISAANLRRLIALAACCWPSVGNGSIAGWHGPAPTSGCATS
jgi:hypothetical protein